MRGTPGFHARSTRATMEDSALEADLVATLEEAISELAPVVQGMCVLPQICAGLQSYGCIRLRDFGG